MTVKLNLIPQPEVTESALTFKQLEACAAVAFKDFHCFSEQYPVYEIRMKRIAIQMKYWMQEDCALGCTYSGPLVRG